MSDLEGVEIRHMRLGPGGVVVVTSTAGLDGGVDVLRRMPAGVKFEIVSSVT